VKKRPKVASSEDLLKVLRAADRAMHAREIFSHLELPESAYLALLELLHDLVYDGVLSERPGQKFTVNKRAEVLAAPTGGQGTLVNGTLSVNQRGFGFVAPEGPRQDKSKDIFIPEDSLEGAMHGDKVSVRIVNKSNRGFEGHIERIIERGRIRVGGILRRRGNSAWLEPDDARVRGPITLTSALDQVAGIGNSGNDGDAAVVRITKFPHFPGENPEGVLEAVLGKPGTLNVEARKLVLVSGIQEFHGDEAIAQAEGYGIEVPESMLEGRVDLTDIPLPTIDPEDARDHDDAVWVEMRPEGGFRAWVAIADVSSYVRPSTALDAEALDRGCSVYLPDRAIPMLPRALSSNLCSLLPNVVRLCLCVIADFDETGKVVHYDVVRGFMNSRAKLTYGTVARALKLTDEGESSPEAEAMAGDLRVAYDLSRMLRARRVKRGCLDFALPEPKVILNAEGEPERIERRGQDPGVKRAYELIEELMILANELVAEWLIAKRLPAIFRVHGPPDAQKLERLLRLCEALDVEFGAEDAQDPKKLGAFIAQVADHPMGPVLNMLLLRSMKQATYDPTNIGHFGLASKAYLHFTSPIRRYPDLVVHRIVHGYLDDRRRKTSDAEVEQIGQAAAQSSKNERRAMELERDVLELYRAYSMKDRLGETFEGMVTGVVGSGLYITLDDPFVDVMVRMEDLGMGFEIDEDGLGVFGPSNGEVIQLGDRLTIEVVDVSLTRRQVYAKRPGYTREARGEGDTPRRKFPAPRLPTSRGRGPAPGQTKGKGKGKPSFKTPLKGAKPAGTKPKKGFKRK
jgi:ribonuclease R